MANFPGGPVHPMGNLAYQVNKRRYDEKNDKAQAATQSEPSAPSVASVAAKDVHNIETKLKEQQDHIASQYGQGYNRFMETMLPGAMAQVPNMMQTGAAALPGNNQPQQFAPEGAYDPVLSGLPQHVQQQGVMENLKRLLSNPTLLAQVMSGSQNSNVPHDRDPPTDQRRGLPGAPVPYSSGYWGNDNEVT